MWRRALLGAISVGVLLLVLGCGGGSGSGPVGDAPAPAGQAFPDVVEVRVTGGEGVYDFAATVSSPYDTPERYADGWRVLAPDGDVLGERSLAHDHAGEQPFTRSLSSVAVPAGIEVVTVQARDLVNGYGGDVVRVRLPDR